MSQLWTDKDLAIGMIIGLIIGVGIGLAVGYELAWHPIQACVRYLAG